MIVLVLAVSAPVRAQGVEPRLPAPAETPGAPEALIQRAVGLYASGNFRESAAATGRLSPVRPAKPKPLRL